MDATPSPILEKVTVFITRPGRRGHELLLFQHPNAGIQIPAGTVEAGETPERAALREAAEESGLSPLTLGDCLGVHEDTLPEPLRFIITRTTVYGRPDPASFDWAYLRRGVQVSVLRCAPGFTQVTYEEIDRFPDPQYITYAITGWVPDTTLTRSSRRYFYHLTFSGDTPAQWPVVDGYHRFSVFWSPLNNLPQIVYPQEHWLAYLDKINL